jgi:hypothetical protein
MVALGYKLQPAATVDFSFEPTPFSLRERAV